MSKSSIHSLLTGCAGGIGGHLVDRLCAAGYRVTATDVDEDALRQRAGESRWPKNQVFLHQLDVRDPDAWQLVLDGAVARFGPVDNVMNIAGCLFSHWLQDTPRGQIGAMLDINVKGVIYGTQAAARFMIPRGQGHIINFASMAGTVPIPGLAVYCASKYAVRGFSLSATLELERHGIAVTVVCPDGVDTHLLDQSKTVDAGAIVFSSRRLLTVEQIGDVIMGRVLKKRPVEISVPTGRGLLARLVDVFPSLGFLMRDHYARRGLHHLRAIKAKDPHQGSDAPK